MTRSRRTCTISPPRTDQSYHALTTTRGNVASAAWHGLTAAPNQCNSKSHEIVCVHSAFAFLNTAKSQLRNAAPGRSIAPPTRHR
jgi:hypothetical protein